MSTSEFASGSASEAEEQAILDTRGLLCPLPVIRTQQAIKDMQPAQSLRVLASDPGTLHDIPAWCRVHGHELCCADENDDTYTFIIRVVG